MQKKTKSFIWVSAALLVAVAVGWLSAQSDDRPPIIVTNGSFYVTNGDPTSTITPTPWTDDILLGEWKPVDAGYKGIRGFEVSFEYSYAPTVCADASSIPPAKPTTPLSGDEVRIDYMSADGKTTISTKLHRRREFLFGLFGKNEPKVNRPTGSKNNFTVVNSTRLEFEDPPVGTTYGYIAKVSVGKTDCVFGAPPPPPSTARTDFRVRIQPKIDQ